MSNKTDHHAVSADEEFYYEETVVEHVDNRRRRTILATILVALLFLLMGTTWFVLKINTPTAAPSVAELPSGVSWVRSIYTWGTTANTLLRGPVDDAVAPDGTIWVATNKQIIAGFTPDGRPKRVIMPVQGKGRGQVIALEGIAVSETGDVYVADFGRNAVLVFSAQGAFLREWPVELPNELYVRNGKVTVVTSGGVKVFDLQGKEIASWGKRGRGEENFDLPHGVYVGADGTTFVSDTQNARIRAYTPEGRLLWTRGKTRTTDKLAKTTDASVTINGVAQSLELPAGMTMDSNGRLIVVDPFKFEALVLNPKNGQILARYGDFGDKDGQFAYPTGISYDPQRDTFAVADTANNRIQVIRLPGTGGSLLKRGIAGATDRPWWLCLIPLILIMLAIVLRLTKRRNRAARQDDVQDSQDA